jgi:hypothetical protein
MNYREFEQKGLKECSLIDVFLTSYDIFKLEINFLGTTLNIIIMVF